MPEKDLTLTPAEARALVWCTEQINGGVVVTPFRDAADVGWLLVRSAAGRTLHTRHSPSYVVSPTGRVWLALNDDGDRGKEVRGADYYAAVEGRLYG